MRYNVIGKSGLKVSEIGFGCMSLLKAPDREAASILDAARDAGINYFDTADLYDKGANEILVGQLLKPVRKDIVLATKVGNEWRSDGSGWNWNPRKAYIIKAVEESLRRLETSYIDLYQLHGGTIEDPIEETIEAFEQLVKEGKVRYYGISSIRPNVIRKYVELSDIQSVMMQYSLLDRRPEEEMIAYLGTHGKSILARGVLAQGLLVNKPAKDYLGYSQAEVASLQEQMAGAASNDAARISLALQYVLNQKAVASAVTGFRTLDQLEEVLTGYRLLSAGDQELAVQPVLPPQKYSEHR